ncbi:MAG: hypothetical protein ACFFA4_16840 [Promethearchaeota archaeon]
MSELKIYQLEGFGKTSSLALSFINSKILRDSEKFQLDMSKDRNDEPLILSKDRLLCIVPEQELPSEWEGNAIKTIGAFTPEILKRALNIFPEHSDVKIIATKDLFPIGITDGEITIFIAPRVEEDL